MAVDLQGVSDLLQKSLDPQQHRQAEQAIREAENSPNFSINLLRVVGNESYPQTSRLAAALYFKNLVRRKWVDEEGNYKLSQDEVSVIKRELVGLMISTPPPVQAQLGDAISVIADSDFWERWETLMPDLVSRLAAGQPTSNNGVVQVAHSIFKRWRPLIRSDDLFTEINHVMATFGSPFFSLLQATDNAIEQNATSKSALQENMALLNTSCKVIYDLSCQDLPAALEDNMPSICALLQKYLKYDNNLLHTDEDSEAGFLEYVKAAIFGVLTLWAQKYEDEFGQYIGQFVESSWGLLTTVGPQAKYDMMASRALNFLTKVTAQSRHAAAFNDPGILTQVVEKVILPNIALRESDIELFEDEPIEYVRRDLEGTDSETRRRAATDFLRQLMQQFQETVTKVTQQYISHFMEEYTADQRSNWQSKDTAVYLFCSIAAMGTATKIAGVKTTNPHVDVIDFFQKNIAQDLVADTGHPILQVDAIKYLYVFRSQLKREQWLEAFPLLVRHLGSQNYVVHTYAATAIERVLSLTIPDTNEPVIPREVVVPLSREMLRQIFTLIMKDKTPEKIQENEFLMHCVMRILIVCSDGTLSQLDFVLTGLVGIMKVIRHNPSNPRFYYFLFESMGAIIRFCAPKQPAKLENDLFQPFGEILQDDVAEFIPYVFQLFAALLEGNSANQLPDFYLNLIPPILMPTVWEERGNIPALTRFLVSLVIRAPAHIVQKNQVEPILGIFQKLIASKAHEVHAFDLLESVIASVPHQSLQQYYVTIFNLLLTRLSNSRTENLVLRFVRLYHFMSARNAPDQGLGADAVASACNAVQPDVFTQLYLQIILPDTQKLTRPYDRKTAVISLVRTLTDSTAFADRYVKGWGFTCEALLKLMINPPVPPSGADEDIREHDVDDASFGVGFTQLSTCRKPARDPFPDVEGDLRAWIGRNLREKDQQTGGRIAGFVQNRLSEEARAALVKYMQ